MTFLKSKERTFDFSFSTYKLIDLIYTGRVIRHIYKLNHGTLGYNDAWQLIKRIEK